MNNIHTRAVDYIAEFDYISLTEDLLEFIKGEVKSFNGELTRIKDRVDQRNKSDNVTADLWNLKDIQLKNHLDLKIKFLEKKLRVLGYQCEVADNGEVTLVSLHKVSNTDEYFSFEWKANKTETIEMIKSLIVSGKIIGKEEEIVSAFSNFLNINLDNHYKIITDIKNRNNGSETKFLDLLKSKLHAFLTK